MHRDGLYRNTLCRGKPEVDEGASRDGHCEQVKDSRTQTKMRIYPDTKRILGKEQWCIVRKPNPKLDPNLFELDHRTWATLEPHWSKLGNPRSNLDLVENLVLRFVMFSENKASGWKAFDACPDVLGKS
ncbi:hypothetical protein RRG08_037543 [Elysia crispata]|uniref:Uncharacterized protein n=1 Tax=Elysia crispata TaxID=231223 RepID=A0AAE0Y647_9GAST|nr:hypothetical protein RRG08_037543 [Elysia crispata]